jgi:hypothetical protein
VDLVAAVNGAVGRHPAVRDIRLTGSRARGEAHDLSDWDFVVETSDFEAVAGDLNDLVAPLASLAAQWDPFAGHACYMLMLPGAVKVDLLFLDQPREWAGAWEPSAATLPAIDRHFWDWILYVEQKRRGGPGDRVSQLLADMHRLMLSPMGAAEPPASVAEAVDAYVAARERLEHDYGIEVPRALEREVRPVVSP